MRMCYQNFSFFLLVLYFIARCTYKLISVWQCLKNFHIFQLIVFLSNLHYFLYYRWKNRLKICLHECISSGANIKCAWLQHDDGQLAGQFIIHSNFIWFFINLQFFNTRYARGNNFDSFSQSVALVLQVRNFHLK